MKIFLLTIKGSKRKIAIKRLKDLKIKFEIFYGVDCKKIKKKLLKKIYDPLKTKKNIGRYLSPAEIGTSASHIAIYKKIVRENIKNAIILEDDIYISDKFLDWIKTKRSVKKNEILSFFATPSGFIKKRSKFSIILNNESIRIHESASHLFSCAAYQIHKSTCKKILKKNEKVCNIPDWPFNFKEDKIKLYLTLPFLCTAFDKNFSHLNKDRLNYIKKENFILKLVPKKLSIFIKNFAYFTYLHYLFNDYPLSYFNDHFFLKTKIKILNFFNKKYLALDEIFYNRNYINSDIISKHHSNSNFFNKKN